jgi:hypothetical protein
MQIPLKRHPSHPGRFVAELYVDMHYAAPTLLDLWYVVQGELDRIVIPARAEARRADNLWETTCFELFLTGGEGKAYHEFNFSPSGEWAAYSFPAYREGRHAADLPVPPIISSTTTPWSALEVHVTVPLDAFALVKPVFLNLAAVIEEKGGDRSYWALSQPPDEPDFHDPACFALELPAAEPA